MISVLLEQVLRHNAGKPAAVEIILPEVEVNDSRCHFTCRERKGRRKLPAVSVLLRVKGSHLRIIPVKARVSHSHRLDEVLLNIILILLTAQLFNDESQ